MKAATPFLLLGVVVAAYAVLAVGVLAPDAVYSGDIGVKYVQAHALAGHHFTSLDIPYPGAALDSIREYFPIRAPFVLWSGGAAQAIFSPASAAIDAIPVALGGVTGMVLMSVVGAALVLYAAQRLVQPDGRAFVIVALGLGSPLWFYAVSGWEHALAVGLGTLGFALAQAGPGRAGWAATGLLIGAGATIRDEVLLLLPGLLVMAWVKRRSVSSVVVVIAAAALPLGASAVAEIGFGRPAAAHLRHAVHAVHIAADAAGTPDENLPSLDPLSWRERYQTVVSYWLIGYGPLTLGAFAAGLALAIAVWHLRGSPVLVFAWVLAVAVFAVCDTWTVVAAPRWVAGLFRLSPFVVFTLLPPPTGEGGGDLPRAVVVTACLYLLLAFVAIDTTGGKSLGPRLLLPLLPLLVAAAAVRIRWYLGARGRLERAIGVVGLVLVLSGIAMHAAGTVPAYVERNRENRVGLRAVASTHQPYVLADDEFVAQMLLPLYFRRVIFLVDTRELGRSIGARLMEARIPEVIMVSRRSTPAISLWPYNVARIEPAGRLVIQYWRRY